MEASEVLSDTGSDAVLFFHYVKNSPEWDYRFVKVYNNEWIKPGFASFMNRLIEDRRDVRALYVKWRMLGSPDVGYDGKKKK